MPGLRSLPYFLAGQGSYAKYEQPTYAYRRVQPGTAIMGIEMYGSAAYQAQCAICKLLVGPSRSNHEQRVTFTFWRHNAMH